MYVFMIEASDIEVTAVQIKFIINDVVVPLK